MLIDTHCHLTHERFEEDRLEVLARARTAGVGGVVSVASTLDDAAAVQRLVRGAADAPAAAEVRGTAGVHPHEAKSAPKDLRARLDDFLDEHPDVVAVGECGLDHHYDFAPRGDQRRVFETHLDVAGARELPVVVHCREAEADMIPMVREAGRAGVHGVLHCYPGDLELLETALDAGWLVSFTGLVTFRSFDGVEAVRRVPPDRYMLETDGPYMAPVPHRGKRNEPARVPHIRDRVAEIRGEPAADVERATTETAVRFFAAFAGLAAPAPGP